MSRLLRGKQLADLTITGGKIAATTITPDKLLVAGQTYNFTSATDVQVPSTPAGSNSAVSKAYADSIAQGLDIKDASDAVAIANVASLSGLQTIDGVSLLDGDRVLLVGQTNQVNNGIWVVHSGAWTRPADFLAGSSASGAFTFITGGTSYEGTGWVCTAEHGYDLVGTNDLPFTQFSGAGSIEAGQGLYKTGNTLNVGDANKGVQVNADNVQVDASEISGNGLEQVAGVGNEHLLTIKPDVVGGANLACVISVTANGVAVKVDSKTISANGSNQLQAAKRNIGNMGHDPLDTNSDGDTTGITLAATPDGGRVAVLVNGVEYEAGNGVKTKDCYFSADGGTTALAFSALVSGNTLYWNGSIAGFELKQGQDVVDLDYDTLA